MSREVRRVTRDLRVLTMLLTLTVIISTVVVFSARARAADDASNLVYVCRPVTAGETSNAQMTAASGTALECHPVSMTLKLSDGSLRTIGIASANSRKGPDLSTALTPGQVNDAWVDWLEAMFSVTHTP